VSESDSDQDILPEPKPASAF